MPRPGREVIINNQWADENKVSCCWIAPQLKVSECRSKVKGWEGLKSKTQINRSLPLLREIYTTHSWYLEKSGATHRFEAALVDHSEGAVPDQVFGVELVDADVGHHLDDHLLLLLLNNPIFLLHWLTAFEHIPAFSPFFWSILSSFSSTAWFLSRRNNLVSSQDFSSFLSFVFLVVPNLQPRFLCLPEFSVFLCFNWVVSGFPCVSWLRPSRGALHSSAEWSGREIVPPQKWQKLSQILQDLISFFLKYDPQMCPLVLD